MQCCGVFAVIKLDGSTPVRYGLRLNMDEKYTGLKKQLSELCSLKPEQILLTEVHASNIKVLRLFHKAESVVWNSEGERQQLSLCGTARLNVTFSYLRYHNLL